MDDKTPKLHFLEAASFCHVLEKWHGLKCAMVYEGLVRMAITISEAMELQSLKKCTIVAGERGCGKIVNSVGIIDNFHLVQENMERFHSVRLQDKLMLSMYFVSYTFEQQEACLRFLFDSGASGLVIYRSDLLDGTAAREILSLADSLDFPIIQAPERYYAYSEIITDIMQAVTARSMSLSPVFQCLSGAADNGKTMDDLLRTITETTNLYVAVYDWDMNLIYASAPEELLRAEQYVQNLLERTTAGSFDSCGDTYYFRRGRLTNPNDLTTHAVVISKENPTNEVLCQQIMDIIQLFSFGRCKCKTTRASLGRALLDGELLLARHHAKNLGVSIDRFRFLVVCYLPRPFREGEAMRLSAALESFFSQNEWNPIIEHSERGVTLFLRSPTLESELVNSLETFSANAQKTVGNGSLRFLISVLDSPASIKETYKSCLQYAGAITRLFPYAAVFTNQQIAFAKSITAFAREAAGTSIQTILAPLNSSWAARLELSKTLAAYMLDANGSVELTAAILNLHKSTVKYRLQRANELLDCDVRKMPAQCHLYVALAISRLTEE